ncbi:MAG: hypothetical protein L0K67_01595, partial [Brevibacterium sp.]|nr:hypothetical protein [Brevibacterium sp.]
MTDTAREEILGRINQALGRRGGGEYVSSSSGTVPAGSPTGGEGHSSAAEAPHAQPGAPAAGGGTVDQSADYFRTGTHEGEELIELLVDR